MADISHQSPRLFLYLANIRLPTEKAHGLQIMQNCEAFTAQLAESKSARPNGVKVELWAAARINTAKLRTISDIHGHYGVLPTFAIHWLSTLDLLPLGRVLGRLRGKWPRKWFERAAFPLQALTFMLSAIIALLPLVARVDTVYSRDPWLLLLLSAIMPAPKLVYEAHQRAQSRIGAWGQRACVRRVGLTVAVTDYLRAALVKEGARHAITEHDGYSAARFSSQSNRAAARAKLGILPDRIVVGYVGQLHTMGMGKGVDTLLNAVIQLRDPRLCVLLVGGPDTIAAELRAVWIAHGMNAADLITTGQVSPNAIPGYMACFDIAAMNLPFTEHFAYYASPLKLFEYMVSGCAIIASDLPAVREVVQDGDTALLTVPGDLQSVSAAIQRLSDDRGLRATLAANAHARALYYTWHARAGRILGAIRG